jgi:hypothetical protein
MPTTNKRRTLAGRNKRDSAPDPISGQIGSRTCDIPPRQAPGAQLASRNRGASDLGIDRLEESYRRKIDIALRREGIRGKPREKLVRWREEGLRQICPKPENLTWLEERVWKSLNRSVRVSTVFAVCDIDRHPNAVSELYTELGRLMEPFRGRPTKGELSLILAKTARLRQAKFSWLQIAQRLCPDRSPNHSCDKKCADRIRVASQRLAKAK